MKILVLSDTHGKHKQVKNIDPDTDMVIHCGDATNHYIPHRNYYEWIRFIKWFTELPIKYKVYIPGNHDAYLYHHLNDAKDNLPENTFIIDRQFLTIEDITIYGDAYTLPFNNWFFMNDEIQLSRIYNMISDQEVDIVVTHGPPYGIRDLNDKGQHSGSKSLSEYVIKTKPKYHLFGHLHNVGSGIKNNGISVIDDVTYINASFVDMEHHPNGEDLIYINL